MMYYLFIKDGINWNEIYVAKTIQDCKTFIQEWISHKPYNSSEKFKIMKLEIVGDVSYYPEMTLIKTYEVRESD